MNRPKEVKIQLKNPAIKNSIPYERGSKQSSTPQHEKVSKKREKIKQKNGPQNKLGFRDTSTGSSRLCQYLYSSVRRGRQEGRKTERLVWIKCETIEQSGEGERTKMWGEEIEIVQENKRFKPWKQRVLKGISLKGFGFGLYGVIKCIRSGLYGGNRAVKYFIFISISKLIKTILKL